MTSNNQNEEYNNQQNGTTGNEKIIKFNKEQNRLLEIASQEHEFDEVIELENNQQRDFPTGVFCKAIEDKVLQETKRFNSDYKIGIGSSLIALSTLLQTRVKFHGVNNFTIVLNLWVLVFAPSGRAKSPIEKEILKHLTEYERKLIDDFRDKIATINSDHKIVDELIRKTEMEKSKAIYNESNNIEEIGEKLNQLQKRKNNLPSQIAPQLVYDSLTPEALIDRLKKQDGSLSIVSSESAIFNDFASGGNGKGAPMLEGILETFDRGTIKRDIKGDDGNGLIIHEATTSILATLQPQTIKNIHPMFHQRGFTNRFVTLFASPPTEKIVTNAKYEPNIEIEHAYKRLFDKAINLKDVHLTLDDEAKNEFITLTDYIQNKYLFGSYDEEMKNYSSKMVAILSRFVGLIAITDLLDTNNDMPIVYPKEAPYQISIDVINRVKKLVPVILEGAEQLFNQQSESTGLEKYLVKKIEEKRNGNLIIARSTIKDATKRKTGLESSEELDNFLAELEDKNYIHSFKEDGKRKVWLYLNPQAFK